MRGVADEVFAPTAISSASGTQRGAALAVVIVFCLFIADEIRCILVLPCALCVGNIVLLERIYPLAGEYCVTI